MHKCGAMYPNLSKLSIQDPVPIDGKREGDDNPFGQFPPMTRNTNEDVIPYMPKYDKIPTIKHGETRYGPQQITDHSIEWCMWFKPRFDEEGAGNLFKYIRSERDRIRTNFKATMDRFWSDPPPKDWDKRLLMYVDDQATGEDQSRMCRVLFCLYLPKVYVNSFIKWMSNFTPDNMNDVAVSNFAEKVLGIQNALGTNDALYKNFNGKPHYRGPITNPSRMSLKNDDLWPSFLTREEYEALEPFNLITIYEEKGARMIPGQLNENDAAKLAERYPEGFIVEWEFFLKNTLAGMGDGSFGINERKGYFQDGIKEWFEEYMSNWNMPDIKERLIINTYEYETLERTESRKRDGTLEPLSPVTRVECQLFLPRCPALAFKYMLDYMIQDGYYEKIHERAMDGTDYAMQQMFGVTGAKALQWGFAKVRIEPVRNHSEHYGDVTTFNVPKYEPRLDVDTYNNDWKAWNWVTKTNHSGPQVLAPPPVYLDPSFGPAVIIERHLLLGF